MTLPTAENFPVNLDRVMFSRMTVEAVQEFQASPNQDGPRRMTILPENAFSLTHGKEGDTSFIYASTRVVFNAARDPSAPYFFDFECHAKFLVREGISEDRASAAATITGHSVTYGAIREAVAWMTGRFPYGPFLLGLSILNPATEQQN